MVKLRMNLCDEINHAGVSYRVSNSNTDLGVGEVDVPPEVAALLLSVSAGAVLADPPQEPAPLHPCRMRHPDPAASFSWNGQIFDPDGDGVVTVPAAAVQSALDHGFAGPIPDLER